MSRPRRTRWVCPVCEDGKLGPRKPRKENIIRYCLSCSEKAGKLIERTTPALDRQRKARAEKSAEQRSARAKREREKEKRRTHVVLRDAAGRVVELDPVKETKRLAKKAGIAHVRVTWNRRADGFNTGRASTRGRVHLSIGSRSLEQFCSLMAHELAHFNTPWDEHHGDVWRDEYERICAVLWDTKPVFRLAVQHHRYAIDPEIESQLRATSLGEYRRSKAKLPLAGRLVTNDTEKIPS